MVRVFHNDANSRKPMLGNQRQNLRRFVIGHQKVHFTIGEQREEPLTMAL